MNHYFVHDNANRRLKVGQFSFAFEVVENVGGAWRGVLKTEDDAAYAAVLTLIPEFGIREITAEQYEEFLKKKTASAPLSRGPLIRTPQFHEGDRAAAAVVVGAPASRPAKGEVEIKKTSAAPLADVLKVGKAPFVDPVEVKPASKKKQKASA